MIFANIFLSAVIIAVVVTPLAWAIRTSTSKATAQVKQFPARAARPSERARLRAAA